MERIGAYEAKTHLPELIRRVSKGERIIITKHGVEVALIQPPEPEQKSDTKDVIRKIRAFRKKHVFDGMTIREMIEQGRR